METPQLYTNNATEMYAAFANAKNIKTVYNYNTINVTNM